MSIREKALFSLHSPRVIASDPQLLLQLFRASYQLSLVVSIWRQKGADLLHYPSLQQKAQAASQWLKENIDTIRVLNGHGTSDKIMTCLPKEIYDLKNLKRLDLSENGLRTLSDAIGLLSNLSSLNLSSNQLRSIPEPIGSLTRLTSLNLCNNQLVALPKGIEAIASNLEIVIVDAYLKDYLPDVIRFHRGLELYGDCSSPAL
jgi:hypothetical protein